MKKNPKNNKKIFKLILWVVCLQYIFLFFKIKLLERKKIKFSNNSINTRILIKLILF